MRRVTKVLVALSLLSAYEGSAFAQQRPLVTEDPETVGSGQLLVEAGFDYSNEQTYPASGLEGDLTRFAVLGVSIGFGSIAEVQFDGGLYNRLTISERRPAPLDDFLDFDGDTTTDVDDLVVGTKVRITAEDAGRPAMGIRVATKLPNASNESGLGLDTTDFFASFLLAKTVGSVRTVGNIGLGILGDPIRGDRQNDVLTYGVSVASAVAQGAEVVAEINGRFNTREGEPPPGSESRSVARVGFRYTRGAGRIDGFFLLGVTNIDPTWGFGAGYTYVFNAFQVP